MQRSHRCTTTLINCDSEHRPLLPFPLDLPRPVRAVELILRPERTASVRTATRRIRPRTEQYARSLTASLLLLVDFDLSLLSQRDIARQGTSDLRPPDTATRDYASVSLLPSPDSDSSSCRIIALQGRSKSSQRRRETTLASIARPRRPFPERNPAALPQSLARLPSTCALELCPRSRGRLILLDDSLRASNDLLNDYTTTTTTNISYYGLPTHHTHLTVSQRPTLLSSPSLSSLISNSRRLPTAHYALPFDRNTTNDSPCSVRLPGRPSRTSPSSRLQPVRNPNNVRRLSGMIAEEQGADEGNGRVVQIQLWRFLDNNRLHAFGGDLAD